ncbi:MAG: Rho termination factor N-terminal domain-containing protein, partial [Muribaculaceae bacterium]|nr:Rho termination factor N-terminal domain-containing protein [Muribaculaceae bacterium]
MHSLTDLNAMGDAELKQVAEDLGIKKPDLTEKQELIYRILDEQAIKVAATKAAEQKRRAEAGEEPKKRGRRKKEAAPEGAKDNN